MRKDNMTAITGDTWLAAILKYGGVYSAKGAIIPVMAAVED